MTKRDLDALLIKATGKKETVAGYNYAIYSVRTSDPESFLYALMLVKKEIEKYAGTKLLSFVGLCRAKSVVVPVPWETPLNLVSEAIEKYVTGVKFTVPYWS